MRVTAHDLAGLRSHWAISALSSDDVDAAWALVARRTVAAAVGMRLTLSAERDSGDDTLLERVALAHEIAGAEGLRALIYPSSVAEIARAREQAQAAAYVAFEMRRAMQPPEEPRSKIYFVLHVSALAYSSERWTDMRRWIRETPDLIQQHEGADAKWDERLLNKIFQCWVRLVRKEGWSDLEVVPAMISGLRAVQREFETALLDDKEGAAKRAAALQLVSLYHWAKATELLAQYMLQGEPRAIETQLDQHFEAAIEAARAVTDHPLEALLLWLHAASKRMVAGSIWWVAHTVNSRVSKFVENVVRSRGMFELLPPQRAALREEGLLDVANHAIVVDLPTSAGKTVLAQFRILQALNQFSDDNGWVAYVAPTRALVAQITRRLRKDFAALNVSVEALTPAVEFDAFEEALLGSKQTVGFHVLVTTPEKLQLVIRNRKIPRPMALVVLDEAHNIADEGRGLRSELLLATIKRDCPSAGFLLLTPFVPDQTAKELASWLAPDGNSTISLGTAVWQPNERIIGSYRVVADDSVPRGWKIEFETLTTSRRTLHLRGTHTAGPVRPLNLPPSKVKSLTAATAAIAAVFGATGKTSVAIARTILDTWSLARLVAANGPPADATPEVALVQRFLSTEVSRSFELVDMLGRGVGVHHAGLSEEGRTLIEWLAECGHLRVLCATTTLAQGINFPVSSVFLASRMVPHAGWSEEMSPSAFWNLAGRAGRMDQDSVGVVGLAEGADAGANARFVSRATEELVSRLIVMLSDLETRGTLGNLDIVMQQDQWADFRGYIAHLWNEKKNLDAVLAESEQFLRNTLGYRVLQSRADESSKAKARALLDATRSYARRLAQNPHTVAFADSTGFAPEGVNTAIAGLRELQRQKQLTVADWRPESLFGANSNLPRLIGVMMRIPEIRKQLEELSSGGSARSHVAQVAQAWVGGASIEDIATQFFKTEKGDLTGAITEACKGIYRVLGNAGTWGLAALLQLPGSGISFDTLTDADKRSINNIPAMLFYGVRTEEAILMRLNSVPRSIAEAAGRAFKQEHAAAEPEQAPSLARAFLTSLSVRDWDVLVPAGASMSGEDYRAVWRQLSGGE